MEFYLVVIEMFALFAVLMTFVCKKSKADKIALLSMACILVGLIVKVSMEHATSTLRWVLIQLRPSMIEGIVDQHLHWFIMALIGAFALMRYAMVDTRVVKPLKRSYTPEYIPESMKPGSSFQLNALNPAFQCEVHGSVDGNDYFPLGQAFWVAQGLVTAAHVIYDVDYVYLARGDCQIEVDKSDFEFLDGDIAIYKITQKETQALKMSQGKLSNLAVGCASGLMAQIVAFGQRSFGFLQLYDQFGYCCYSGSTLKGFSGAPYYLNKTIFGMHLGGSVDNLGYEAAYILSVLRPSKTVVKHQESSDDWLIEQAQKSNKFDYERNPYNPDEYRVKMNGRYHMVDGQVLGEMLECGSGRLSKREVVMGLESMTSSSSTSTPEPSLPLAPRGALEYEPGNLIRAPAVVAGARGVELAHPSVQLPDSRTSSPMASLYRAPLVQYHMESLRSTPVPPKGVSPSTARNRRRRQRIQQLEKRVEQLSKPVQVTVPGQPI